MIDLILRASTEAAMSQWAKDHGLMEHYVDTPAVLDDEGTEVTPAVMAWRSKPGLAWSWWNGSGNLMTAHATYDAEGNELTPPTFAPGVVLMLRLHHEFFEDDRLDTDEEQPEQWRKSKVARYIKNNGTPGTQASISYYEMDGVRLYRAEDVFAFCDANGVPGHGFL